MCNAQVCNSAHSTGAAAERCPVLGLFNLANLSRLDPSRPPDERGHDFHQKLREHREFCRLSSAEQENWSTSECQQFSVDSMTRGVKHELTDDTRPEFDREEWDAWDSQRVPLDDLIKTATASSPREVRDTIEISCLPTLLERAWNKRSRESNPALRGPAHAMMDRVTHAVVFEGRPPNKANRNNGSYESSGAHINYGHP